MICVRFSGKLLCQVLLIFEVNSKIKDPKKQFKNLNNVILFIVISEIPWQMKIVDFRWYMKYFIKNIKYWAVIDAVKLTSRKYSEPVMFQAMVTTLG